MLQSYKAQSRRSSPSGLSCAAGFEQLAGVLTPLKKQPVSNVAENTVYVYPLEIYVFVSNIQFSRG